MAHKSIAHYDANSSGKLELSTLSRGQLIRRVADLRRQLCEQRAHSDCEWELVTIYRDTAKPEREAIMQINHQLLMQIKTLQKAQQRVIELSAWGTPDNTPEVYHLAASTDLRFQLNKMRC